MKRIVKTALDALDHSTLQLALYSDDAATRALVLEHRELSMRMRARLYGPARIDCKMLSQASIFQPAGNEG